MWYSFPTKNPGAPGPREMAAGMDTDWDAISTAEAIPGRQDVLSNPSGSTVEKVRTDIGTEYYLP